MDLFDAMLNTIKVELVTDNLYCQKYLGHLLIHRKYYLSVYVSVFEKILTESNLPINEITLLDYGAGNGLMGIFAKYCGFGKVFINEIDETFLLSAKKTSAQLNIDIDAFIFGDIKTVKKYFTNKKLDAIAATDVIEHIYDLSEFFSVISEINPEMISVFTTGSNPENIFKVHQLKKLQRKDEYFGSHPDDFLLSGNESHPAFYDIRKQIIVNHGIGMSEKEVNHFAELTRGLIKEDLLKALEQYKLEGQMPVPITHPTNTCHPISGSWTERILTIGEYKKIYVKNGFALATHAGFFDVYKKGLKGFVNKILNKFLIVFGVKFSPFIILTGKKEKFNGK